MFSVCSLTVAAKRAMAAMASSLKESFRPSVSSSAMYCLMSAFFGSVRMRMKSASESELSSTRIGKRPWQLGDQVRGLRGVERAGRDEEDVVGADHAVARVDRGAFDDRKNVALHAFARNVGAVAGFAAGDFVDLVDEEDAHLLDAIDGDARDLVHVDEAIFFFLDEVIEGLGDRHLALLFLLAEHAGEHVLDVDVHFLDALIGDDFEGGHRALADLDFDEALIELAFAELNAELVARALGLLAALGFRGGAAGHARFRGGRRRRRQQEIEQALFGGLLGALGHFVELFLAHHVDRGFHQIADHRFDVAAHVADFGVLRRFDFDERAAREARKAAGDFRLAHAGGPDHQDIFRQDFLGKLGLEFLAANAIAQSDGDGFLRRVLAHDVFIELDDDFARRQLVERRERFRLRGLLVSGQVDHHIFLRLAAHSSSMLKLALVKMQISLAMRIASCAMSLALSFVCLASARADATA